MPIVILAHGALGAFDEIIFVSIAIVFIGMMAFSWFKSQQLPDDETDEPVISQEQFDSEHFELK
jgi:nitrogen fixation-related uncharacterized protein